jgi:predicted nucleic acid-binding protein
MTFVLDACAIIASLRNENGAEAVGGLRRGSTAQADELLDDLSSIGLITRDDIDASLWKTAAGFKANIRRVSLADCFAIAMTKRLNAELMTSDHHEFDAIDAQGICPINFIR